LAASQRSDVTREGSGLAGRSGSKTGSSKSPDEAAEERDSRAATRAAASVAGSADKSIPASLNSTAPQRGQAYRPSRPSTNPGTSWRQLLHHMGPTRRFAAGATLPASSTEYASVVREVIDRRG
jgi:hypothetical protein